MSRKKNLNDIKKHLTWRKANSNNVDQIRIYINIDRKTSLISIKNSFINIDKKNTILNRKIILLSTKRHPHPG